jgi:hypothetical protein
MYQADLELREEAGYLFIGMERLEEGGLFGDGNVIAALQGEK